MGYKTVIVNYGTYKKKKLEIDPETAPIVKEIFDMRANDVKIMDIVNYLNSRGIKTVRGQKFQKSSLQKLLSNKRYIGTNIYSGMEFPNTIPAIIDESTFYKVQEIVEKYKYAPAISKAKEEYILTSKLFCGNCGEKMTGISGTSHTGLIYHYYTCNGVKKNKCKRKIISKDVIEDCVINNCKRILTKDNIEKIAKCVYDTSKKENFENNIIKYLKKEQKQIERAIENLIIALEAGENLDLINKRLNQKREEQQEILKKIYQEERKVHKLSESYIKFFLENLKEGKIDDIKYRKMLVNLFINKIYLYDKKLTIVFNVGKNTVKVDAELLQEINNNLDSNIKFLNENEFEAKNSKTNPGSNLDKLSAPEKVSFANLFLRFKRGLEKEVAESRLVKDKMDEG